MAGFVGIVVLVLLLVVLFNVVASRDRVIRELREQSGGGYPDITDGSKRAATF